MKKYTFLLFGAGFGFLLSRAGATTYDFYAKLFLFEDFQLLWIIADCFSRQTLQAQSVARRARVWFGLGACRCVPGTGAGNAR